MSKAKFGQQLYTAGSQKDRFFWIFAGLKKTRHISSVFSSFKLENDGFKQQIVDNYFLETGRL